MEAREVLDTNLLIEGKVGLTTAFNTVEYPKVLEREVKVIWPDRRDFLTAVELMVDIVKAGTPVPAIDVLVAAICLNRKSRLATKDKHFRHIKAMREGFDLRIVE